MWTRENRGRDDRSKLRYPTNLTDEGWALLAPLIPPVKGGGNKRSANVREVVNGLMYGLGTGCQLRVLPKNLSPRSTVHGYRPMDGACQGSRAAQHRGAVGGGL